MLLGEDCSHFFIFIFISSYFKKEWIWIYLYIKAPLWIFFFLSTSATVLMSFFFFFLFFLSSWYFLIVSTAEVSFTKQTMLSLSKCKQKCTDALSYCQSWKLLVGGETGNTNESLFKRVEWHCSLQRNRSESIPPQTIATKCEEKKNL